MKLTITIELDNNAPAPALDIEEIERLLSSVTERIPCPPAPTHARYSLHDAEGQWCGEFYIDE